MRLKPYMIKQSILIVCTIVLLSGSFLFTHMEYNAHAANPGTGNTCAWYRVHFGDTLANIAYANHANIWSLARVNNIGNVNLIFAGQLLCIPHPASITQRSSSAGGNGSGTLASGYVSWYNYGALQWSTRGQVTTMLRQIAWNYGLPVKLVLAIGLQESGWTQHVIARDGGIGVMQLMPYTAMSINTTTGIYRDPYKLWDNLNLGATYLRWLWNTFHGNLYQVISAYNEGGWAVMHRGIFNWTYVRSVLYLMNTF